MSGRTLPSGITETTATVADGHTALDLHLSGQTYIEVLRGGRRVMRAATTQPSATVSLPPGSYVIRSDGAVTTGTSRDASAPALAITADAAAKAVVSGAPILPSLQPRLQLSSEAEARNEVDGVACVPADGHSFAMITVQQATVGGGAAQMVYLRATGGRIMDEAGKEVIRSVKLQGGSAKFRLVAQTEPRVVTVSALTGPPPQIVSVDVEFLPI